MNKNCFGKLNESNDNCNNIECKYWENKCRKKCSILQSVNNEHTLQEIGEIFGISRMRVCQIEKNALNKLKKKIFKSL